MSFWDRVSRYRRRQPIAYRFVMFILLFSGGLTLLTTASQLYLDLRWDTRSIEVRMDEVGKSYSSSLQNALWAYDTEEIQLDLQGIHKLPDIVYVRIVTPTGDIFAEGTPPPSSAMPISRSYKLWHDEQDSERVYLGTFEITASLKGLYARILRRIVVILITNAAKTFPVAVFILLLFHWLVARHLHAIANYATLLNVDRLDVPLELTRGEPHASNDELEQVVNAINAMRTSLSERIAERERAERILEKNEALLRAIMEGTIAVINVKDIDGRYILVNHRFEEVLGVRREDVRGKTVFDLLPHDVAERIAATDRLVLDGEKPVDVEEVIPLADGPHTYISLRFPIFDTTGAATAICAISTDVTERKRIEDGRMQLLAKTQEMLQLQEDFLAVASHELRTPVTAIKLQAQLLGEKIARCDRGDNPKIDDISKTVKSMTGRADQLARLVERLLDTSRYTTVEPQRESCELSPVVLDVVRLYQEQVPATKEQIQLELQRGVTGQWEASKIEQIVLNLLTNAVKYGQGKPIRIAVSSDDRDAILVVQDAGIGISSEAQERIFNRFERAVPVSHYGGFGLGLYITRQIILAHGGSIRVDSEPKKGACFTVRLPRAAAAARA